MSNPVFNPRNNYKQHVHLAIHRDIVRAFISQKKPLNHNFCIDKLVKLLECYLQITNQNLQSLNDGNFEPLIARFTAAIASSRLANLGKSRKHYYYKTLEEALIQIAPGRPWNTIINDAKSCDVLISGFLGFDLNQEAVEVWHGWTCMSRGGGLWHCDLYPIYQNFGLKFTRQLHRAIADWASLNAKTSTAIAMFSKFIGELPNNICPTDLHDNEYATSLLFDFYKNYLETQHTNGVTANYFTRDWSMNFHKFYYNNLVPSGIICKIQHPLPKPQVKKILGRHTNLKTDEAGNYLKVKLLTQLPNNLPREEDFRPYAERVLSDTQLMVEWAHNEIKFTWRRFMRFQRLLRASDDKLYELGLSSSERSAIRKFKTYGFIPTVEQEADTWFPDKLETGRLLTLPTSRTLLPFCAALVAECPRITPSFLENLEILSPSGEFTGYFPDSSILVGMKPRRGVTNAQQPIRLTPKATEIVEQIIKLTKPLREYLKTQGDPSYRYLLLECARGFGYPKRIRKLTQATWSPKVRVSISRKLQSKGVSEAAADQLAHQFTLPALRASTAVSIYIRTGNLTEVANALGHKALDTVLLEHYIPKSLKEWVQENRVRGVQEAIVAEAMRDSKYQLEASNFDTLDELNSYLREHSIEFPTSNESTPQESSRVIFGLSNKLLEDLQKLPDPCSLGDQEQITGPRLFGLLEEHLRQNKDYRPDLHALLTESKKQE
ncbi:TPA: hypothetical protein ACHIYU_002658 [Pseudomonas aeruginosa]|uniref:hypothetical protein n=1 Tax=Pseudomonas TaxID=286 RepID=UPI0004077FBA|nr:MULTISPECIES: hypothetical protein [Pseudomonas]EKX2958316.1 hypothetical protein [Pseudomonas aeruginosa]MBG4113942.1 hypothetical protein [Pseudomonas aeruginosa]MBI6936928.1 hypothetical protein [Pseudomonas aeruginosa]MBI8014285.1 hypothetical protein [Pseudomonas aeruginosa]MBV6241899.1 hypothetical protein [Pseudomonas aeruginosa]